MCNKKKCVKKHALKRTTRIAQRAQSVTNGYFGGYIGKRQPTGKLEVRKCMEKMQRLRMKIATRSHASQVRAASGRLMTELEMNSTFRGAVEVFNLCRHLRSGDVLFAECIRTFESCTIDGMQWIWRLNHSQSDATFTQKSVQMYVPPTKKPNVRSNRAKPIDVEIYGFRPCEFPWKFLSPFEFFRYWKAEPLLIPTYYANQGVKPRTQWTAAGKILVQSAEYKTEKIAAKPGIDYVVLPSPDNSYHMFPETPSEIYDKFRHAWVLVRRIRPQVVMIEGVKKPNKHTTAIDAAKYGCLFFRP